MPDIYVASTLRRRWDDASGTFLEWDADGTLVATRPYTPVEVEAAGVRAARAAKDSASAAMVAQAAGAVAVNAAYLDIPVPSVEQVAAQVRALTLQAQALSVVAAATLAAQGA